jgi:hypothetical protein
MNNIIETWEWPLWCGPKQMPDYPGTFGAARRFDIHTGVDLYTYPGMPVLAVEDGVVVKIEDFTGEQVGSPWWNDTEAILIEGTTGVVCYGELAPLKGIQVGQKVLRGDCLGCILPVLKKDKGKPMSMLHLELYDHGTRDTVIWNLNQPQPSSLKDPTPHLLVIL